MDDIANADIADRHLGGVCAVRTHACSFWLQADQAFNGGTGATFGARLQIAPGQYQGSYNACGFKIDGTGPLREQTGSEHCQHRVGPCSRGTQNHQRIHIGSAGKQRGYSAAKKASAGSDKHQRNQNELQPPTRCMPQSSSNKGMCAGDKM